MLQSKTSNSTRMASNSDPSYVVAAGFSLRPLLRLIFEGKQGPNWRNRPTRGATQCAHRASIIRLVHEPAGRPLPGKATGHPGVRSELPGDPSGRGKSGLHRTRWWVTPTVRGGRCRERQGRQGPGKCNRKHTAGRAAGFFGKGETVGGPRSLNVRAHQQPGDRLARQTPPGARPNKGAGLVRPVMTLG
jgi:hypothetical protein